MHSISNSGGWSSTGSTRRYQSQTNWYIWNHIQTANLESAEDNFFSVKDGNKRRNLRDKDMSDLAKWAYRKLGLNDDFASSKVFRISMMSLVSQLGEDYARSKNRRLVIKGVRVLSASDGRERLRWGLGRRPSSSAS